MMPCGSGPQWWESQAAQLDRRMPCPSWETRWPPCLVHPLPAEGRAWDAVEEQELEGCGLSHPSGQSPGHCTCCTQADRLLDPSPEDGVGILVALWKHLPLLRVGLAETLHSGGCERAPSGSLASVATCGHSRAPIRGKASPLQYTVSHRPIGRWSTSLGVGVGALLSPLFCPAPPPSPGPGPVLTPGISLG